MADASTFLAGRSRCPCCGYPTLDAGADFEICELCNWEDDGCSDEDADEVRGGPNAGYSLTDARQNFARYRVMYRPEHDTRICAASSELERETKRLLMKAFKDLENSDSGAAHRRMLEEILRLEAILKSETERRVGAVPCSC